MLDALSETQSVSPARSLLLLTNLPAAADALPEVVGKKSAPAEIVVLGPTELRAIVDARPQLRRRLPSVLGVRELGRLIPADTLERSTADLDAARRLARVFVPTRAYARTLQVLERHRFAVLTGPPEMGKTAIARTIGLTLLTEGWELHECTRPDELWQAFARERAQVFVADDAFGSTEYRPEAAERWALELDRVLRAMDDRHWLIWTSRPAPLRAGLRRIHREHGTERFPQPAEVQVAAADLAVEEKALILFRHARGAELAPAAIELVRAHGWEIVKHPHFTPERIRRFVDDRLSGLAGTAGELRPARLAAAVREEIREPTAAMATSLRALPAEHRALLTALLDAPPGPVPERELAAAARRHGESGFSRPPSELVDRLVDHFVRVVPPTSVVWVHPSWRDLVIDELAGSGEARRRFLGRCSLEGLLLALSTGGGRGGERVFPLLIEDGDWDTLTDRLNELMVELEDTELFRLLAALREALGLAGRRDPRLEAELDALAGAVLELTRRRWDREHGPISPTLLEAWLGLRGRVSASTTAPELVPTWIELLPAAPLYLKAPADLNGLDAWLRVVEVLAAHAPDMLAELGFPAGQADVLSELIHEADALVRSDAPLPIRELLAQVLTRLARVYRPCASEALLLAGELAPAEPPSLRGAEAPVAPREAPPQDSAIVARILRDLETGAPR